MGVTTRISQPGTMRHAIVHGPEAVAHHLPSHHPLKSRRADDAINLLTSAAVAGTLDVPIIAPSRASDREIARVHDLAYIEAAERLSRRSDDPQFLRATAREAIAHGFSEDGDNLAYLGMTEAARYATGGVIDAARLVLDGRVGIAFVPAAGANHHARRARASGFGVYNDAAIAIAGLRADGLRVAYVDLDVHHGDGVEAAFATDPGALTISLHESTRYIFPGPPGGLADQCGAGRGVGFAVNVPLSPYTDDDGWLHAFEAIVPPLLSAFRPDLTIVQCGADGYHADPLAHLLLSERAYLVAARRMRELTGGRLVAIGGGGYDPEATARIWASMFATFADLPVHPHWVDAAARAPSIDPRIADRVTIENDATVDAVRQLVFPQHGIAIASR